MHRPENMTMTATAAIVAIWPMSFLLNPTIFLVLKNVSQSATNLSSTLFMAKKIFSLFMMRGILPLSIWIEAFFSICLRLL